MTTTRLVPHPSLEVVPLHGDTLLVRCALGGASLPASRAQIGALALFAAGATLHDVVADNFVARAHHAWLQQAIDAGILLPLHDDAPVFAARAPVATRFAHTPAFDVAHPPQVALLGVPWDRDTTGHPGARFGPAAVRAAAEGWRYSVDPLTLRPLGFFDLASSTTLLTGVSIADAGDVAILPAEDSASARRRMTRALAEVLASGAAPLVVGGDHSITRPLLQAVFDHAPGPLHLVHLDAHSDLGDGFVDGSTAARIGLHHGSVMSVILDELPDVVAIHQLGLRGVVDRRSAIDDERVHATGIDVLRRDGVDGVLARIPGDARCWLSLDIDVVDPAYAPATGTPVPGGLMPHELKDLVRALMSARRFIGADLVEIAAPLSHADGTAALAGICLLHIAQGIVAACRT